MSDIHCCVVDDILVLDSALQIVPEPVAGFDDDEEDDLEDEDDDFEDGDDEEEDDDEDAFDDDEDF